jgi:hypothetical protein
MSRSESSGLFERLGPGTWTSNPGPGLGPIEKLKTWTRTWTSRLGLGPQDPDSDTKQNCN